MKSTHDGSKYSGAGRAGFATSPGSVRDHGMRLKSSRDGQGALRLQHRTFDAAGLSHRRLGCGADLEENRIGEGSADELGLADGLPRAAYSRQMAMQGCIIHGDNMAEPDTSADFV